MIFFFGSILTFSCSKLNGIAWRQIEMKRGGLKMCWSVKKEKYFLAFNPYFQSPVLFLARNPFILLKQSLALPVSSLQVKYKCIAETSCNKSNLFVKTTNIKKLVRINYRSLFFFSIKALQ